MKLAFLGGSVVTGLGVVAALALVGCSSGEGTSGAQGATSGSHTEGTTFFKNAKPIFDAKCMSCHYDGGIAPFSLASWDKAKDYAGLIKQKTSDRTMPPWLAKPGCADYYADKSLTDDEIATIGKWVDDGAQQGDPNDVGAKIDPGPQGGLTRVDKTLKIPGPYTQHSDPDDYHCFVIDWNEATTKFVTGFRANPGDPRVVHHTIAFIARPGDEVAQVQKLDDAEPGPGYTCFGDTGVSSTPFLGGWAPGGTGSDFPPETGIEVPAGSKIILQVHYNSLAAGRHADETTLDFKLDDKVAKKASIQPWANPDWLSGGDSMKIPAMQADVEHSFGYDATILTGGKPFTVYSGSLHMHLLGSQASLKIHRKGGQDECMVDIDKWNFHWQSSYGFTKPKVFNPGDQMVVDCHWNNTPPNQPIINGVQLKPKDTFWGEGTTDEMCVGFFYMTEN